MNRLSKILIIVVAGFAVLGLLVQVVLPPPRPPPQPITITIATNDTKAEWLEEVTKAFNAAGKKSPLGRQIVVEISREGSPRPAAEAIANETIKPVMWSPGDMSWVQLANQIRRDMGKAPVVTGDCPRVVYVATGFAMWRPMAEALGWPDKPIGWKQIVELAADSRGWAKYGHPEWGQFTFGHSHPEYSTTGYNMLATLAYATLGKTTGLTRADVKSDAVTDAFRKVEKNTYVYGTSTTRLLNPMEERGPSYLHAAMASETAVLWPDVHQRDTAFKLVFVFPSEGTYWMDNPTCILETGWVSAEQREAAQIYRDYLRSRPSQERAVDIGLRPVIPDVKLHAPIDIEHGTDPRVSPLTIPPLQNVSGETVAAILDQFRETKKKSTIMLVLDTSASMEGTKIKQAVAASVSFLKLLHRDDKVVVYTFNDTVTELQPSGRVGDVVEGLSGTMSSLFTKGNTALYDAVCTAVERINKMKSEDKVSGDQRLYGVVVLSDGADTNSKRTQNDMFACLPSGEVVQGVRVYTIAYGDDADGKVLETIANRTNGRTFVGDPKTIDQIYLTISAEQ